MVDCGGVVYVKENGILVVLFLRIKEEFEGVFLNDFIIVLRFVFVIF